MKECICGESLEPGQPDNDRRRAHIHMLIKDSQRADEIQKSLTDLYFGVKSLQRGGDNESSNWLKEFEKVSQRRDGIQALRDEAGRKYRALELQLDSLPDTDIQGLRETRRQYMEQRDRYLAKQSTIETQLAEARREREKLVGKRDRFLREQQKVFVSWLS